MGNKLRTDKNCVKIAAREGNGKPSIGSVLFENGIVTNARSV